MYSNSLFHIFSRIVPICQLFEGFRLNTSWESLKTSQHEISYVTSKILKKYNLTSAQANTVCTKIQAAFRGWSVRKTAISNIPSHESWRHDWLWKEFQMSPSEVKAVTQTEKKQPKKGEELLFQPRRSIEIDHIKFMKAFQGELADYDDRSDTSSIGDTTPSEEETEGKHTEIEEEKVIEEPKVIEPHFVEKEEIVEEGPEEQESLLEESQKASSTLLQTEVSEEPQTKPDVNEKTEEEKLLETDELEIEERILPELLMESENDEENVAEEQEYNISEYEPFGEEEHEVLLMGNADDLDPEEYESYFENKLSNDEGIEEFVEEE